MAKDKIISTSAPIKSSASSAAGAVFLPPFAPFLPLLSAPPALPAFPVFAPALPCLPLAFPALLPSFPDPGFLFAVTATNLCLLFSNEDSIQKIIKKCNYRNGGCFLSKPHHHCQQNRG